MPLSPGARLGAYDIVALIGEGGMGEVYRARDTRLGRDVAVKVIGDGFVTDPQRIARFEQEARATASLSHPNIVALFDIGSHDGRPFIVSELLEGQSLRSMLHEGPLPLRKALDYAAQIATGLAAAHDKGIVHRDLKPDNVFITKDGLPKILDFGIAKLRAAPADGETHADMAGPRTDAGFVLGTAAYMAPEQIRGGTVDARTDIFALGTMIFEMSSGTRPFVGATPADTMSAVLAHDPADLVLPDGHTHGGVERLVRRCLEKDPEHRFQSARDLAFALDALTLGTRGSDRHRPLESEAPTARPGVRRSFHTRELVAWTIALIAFPLAAWALWQQPRASVPGAQPVGRFNLDIPFQPGLAGVFAMTIAPDGHALVLAGTSRDRRIQLRDLRDETLRPLLGTENGRGPFWAPDSRAIAYRTDDGVYRASLDGGLPVAIARLSANVNAAFGAWSARGVIVMSMSGQPLHRIVPETNSLEPIAPLDTANGEIAQTAPVFAPDGDHYFYISIRDSKFVTTVASLDGSPPIALPSFSGRIIWAGPDHIVFRRGGLLFAQAVSYSPFALRGEAAQLAADVVEPAVATSTAVSVSNNGLLVYRPANDVRHQFTWIDRAGRRTGDVGPAGNFQGFDLSRDGSKVVVARRDPGVQNLWVFDTARPTVTRVTLDEVADLDPRFAPDAQSVIFGSTRDPLRSPFRATVAGEPPTRLFAFKGRLFALDDWSADGKWLIYHDAATASLQAMRVDEPTAAPVIVARALTGALDQAQMSPDGRFVAYHSNESGEREVYVVPFPPTGEKWQVSEGGGVQPTWRGDGRELYYLSLDGTLMAARVHGGTTFAVEQVTALFKTSTGNADLEIEEYAPAPDGSKFLFRQFVGEMRLRMAVVTNWPGLLRQ